MQFLISQQKWSLICTKWFCFLWKNKRGQLPKLLFWSDSLWFCLLWKLQGIYFFLRVYFFERHPLQAWSLGGFYPCQQPLFLIAVWAEALAPWYHDLGCGELWKHNRAVQCPEYGPDTGEGSQLSVWERRFRSWFPLGCGLLGGRSGLISPVVPPDSWGGFTNYLCCD